MQTLKTSTRSTSSLLSHIEHNHKVLYQEYAAIVAEQTEAKRRKAENATVSITLLFLLLINGI